MRALTTVPDAPDGVAIREVAEPDPAPDEAVVTVRAVALNRGELRLIRLRPDGWGPGQDVAGVVARPAADGSGPSAGSRVVAWPDQGGWAERVAVPRSRLAVLPDEMSFTAAATLPVAGMTALRLIDLGGPLLARRVLVTGAAGGVGRFAVELAAQAGAHVTGVARSAERAAGLDQLGAAAVVHAVEDAEGPYDLILESAGGASLEAAVRLLGPDGLLVVFGNSSTEPARLEFGAFSGAPRSRLYFFFVYESGDLSGFGRDLQRLVDLVASGRLHPQVGFEGSWEDLGAAIRALEQRQVNGKAVLVVDARPST